MWPIPMSTQIASRVCSKFWLKIPFLSAIDITKCVCVCVYEINVHLNSSTTKCRTLMPSILSYIVEIVTLIKMCILLQ